jgi:hypothetical protein
MSICYLNEDVFNDTKNAHYELILLQIRIINACCVLHNYTRDRQYMMDDLLLEEVDNEIAA